MTSMTRHTEGKPKAAEPIPRGTSVTSVTVRIDEQTKVDAARIVEDFGFDLSSVTRAFYRQIVREQRIPLTLSYPERSDESVPTTGATKS